MSFSIVGAAGLDDCSARQACRAHHQHPIAADDPAFDLLTLLSSRHYPSFSP
jgi:hypothetical protein